jgi:hypothetical protein
MLKGGDGSVGEERGGGESGKAAVRLRLEKGGVKDEEGSLFLDRGL